MDNILLTDAEDNAEDVDIVVFDLSGLTKKQIARKIYYEKNKEKIALNKSIIFYCECGRHFSKQQKARHMKGYMHRTFMLNKDKTI